MIELTGRRGRRRKQLLDDLKEKRKYWKFAQKALRLWCEGPSYKKKILEIERGSTRSHTVENSLWKRLRTCRKTDCRMNE
jgi:hypothetical protein